MNADAVFTNSELSLKYVDVYGFDFDYTLVHYTTEVHRLIYETSRDTLVDKLRVSRRRYIATNGCNGIYSAPLKGGGV